MSNIACPDCKTTNVNVIIRSTLDESTFDHCKCRDCGKSFLWFPKSKGYGMISKPSDPAPLPSVILMPRDSSDSARLACDRARDTFREMGYVVSVVPARAGVRPDADAPVTCPNCESTRVGASSDVEPDYMRCFACGNSWTA